MSDGVARLQAAESTSSHQRIEELAAVVCIYGREAFAQVRSGGRETHLICFKYIHGQYAQCAVAGGAPVPGPATAPAKRCLAASIRTPARRRPHAMPSFFFSSSLNTRTTGCCKHWTLSSPGTHSQPRGSRPAWMCSR